MQEILISVGNYFFESKNFPDFPSKLFKDATFDLVFTKYTKISKSITSIRVNKLPPRHKPIVPPMSPENHKCFFFVSVFLLSVCLVFRHLDSHFNFTSEEILTLYLQSRLIGLSDLICSM